LFTGKVKHSFVGETEWHKPMTVGAFALCAFAHLRICALRQKVDEIDHI